jgi:hypothetical protein
LVQSLEVHCLQDALRDAQERVKQAIPSERYAEQGYPIILELRDRISESNGLQVLIARSEVGEWDPAAVAGACRSLFRSFVDERLCKVALFQKLSRKQLRTLLENGTRSSARAREADLTFSVAGSEERWRPLLLELERRGGKEYLFKVNGRPPSNRARAIAELDEQLASSFSNEKWRRSLIAHLVDDFFGGSRSEAQEDGRNRPAERGTLDREQDQRES